MNRKIFVALLAIGVILFLILRKAKAVSEKVTTTIAFEPFEPVECGVARQVVDAQIPIAWCIDPKTGTEFRVELGECKNLQLVFLTDPNIVSRSISLNFDNIGLAGFATPIANFSKVLV